MKAADEAGVFSSQCRKPVCRRPSPLHGIREFSDRVHIEKILACRL